MVNMVDGAVLDDATVHAARELAAEEGVLVNGRETDLFREPADTPERLTGE